MMGDDDDEEDGFGKNEGKLFMNEFVNLKTLKYGIFSLLGIVDGLIARSAIFMIFIAVFWMNSVAIIWRHI